MTDGRIVIDRRMVWAALLAVPLLLFVGVMLQRQGSVIIGGFFITLVLVAGIGALPALSPRLDVLWDDSGVSGPSQAWGPFILLGRSRIGWNEIAALGGTRTGYAYVAAADGRRVYWTESHKPYGLFFEALLARRPDLATLAPRVPAGLDRP